MNSLEFWLVAAVAASFAGIFLALLKNTFYRPPKVQPQIDDITASPPWLQIRASDSAALLNSKITYSDIEIRIELERLSDIVELRQSTRCGVRNGSARDISFRFSALLPKSGHLGRRRIEPGDKAEKVFIHEDDDDYQISVPAGSRRLISFVCAEVHPSFGAIVWLLDRPADSVMIKISGEKDPRLDISIIRDSRVYWKTPDDVLGVYKMHGLLPGEGFMLSFKQDMN